MSLPDLICEFGISVVDPGVDDDAALSVVYHVKPGCRSRPMRHMLDEMDLGVGIGPTWFAFKARLGYQQPTREKLVGEVGIEPTLRSFRGCCPAIRRLSRIGGQSVS